MPDQAPNRLRVAWLDLAYRAFDLPFVLDRRGDPRRAMVRRIPAGARRVVDVCCGPGNSALATARAHPGSSVLGVDLSATALAAARGRARHRRLDNLSLGRMNATHLALADGSCDVATISFGLHELDPDVMLRALAEIARVLAPGGCLHIVDFAPETHWLRAPILAIFLRLVEPPHMPWFLQLDWAALLAGYGLHWETTERYAFTAVISARKA